MPPLTSHFRNLPSYLALCLLAGTAMALFLVSNDHAPWSGALGFSLPVCTAFGFIAASAYWVCRSLPLAQREGARTALLFGAAALTSGALWALLCHAWNQAGGAAVAVLGLEVGASGQWIAISREMTLVLALLGAALYLVSLLAHDLLLGSATLREAQAREVESRVAARDAELQTLRAQINPHFLFNSLNSISALTSIDAAAARAMTLELAAFFRQTLALSQREKIALREEIALCSHFLAIEQIRFGDKLRTDIEVSESALELPIPPMLLQPCVENAVKHGVRSLSGGGTVKLRAWTQDRWLYLRVENPVAAAALDGTGTGLSNIRLRLAALYGDQARISAIQGEQLFCVEIVLPVQEPA